MADLDLARFAKSRSSTTPATLGVLVELAEALAAALRKRDVVIADLEARLAHLERRRTAP